MQWDRLCLHVHIYCTGEVGDRDKGGSSDTCVGTTAVMFWGLLCLNEIYGMSDISKGLLGSQRHERA